MTKEENLSGDELGLYLIETLTHIFPIFSRISVMLFLTACSRMDCFGKYHLFPRWLVLQKQLSQLVINCSWKKLLTPLGEGLRPSRHGDRRSPP